MSNHTPGPWSLWIDEFGFFGKHGMITDDKYANHIAKMSETSNSAANARLIAAAPDLLEALQTIWDSTAVLNHLDSEAQQMICDAIKKATEESA